MKREIRFRAWNTETKIMILQLTMEVRDMNSQYYSHLIYQQFTGLKDKNEKMIWEGDIVKFHYFYQSLGASLGVQESEHELIGVIKMMEYGWGVSAIKGQHWQGYTGYDAGEGESNIVDLYGMSESSLHEESFEVIGNIYENSDLLQS